MHYYRYRPYSELSLKELLYSEIYFTSAEECNDPFDSKTFYVFEANKEKWIKLIKFAVREKFYLNIDNEFIEELAGFISNKCPISIEDIKEADLFKEFKFKSSTHQLIAANVETCIKLTIDVYQPNKCYFVSFSKKVSDSLMWSHYASQHKGFCLIFKAVENHLNVHPLFIKKGISRETPKGIGKKTGFALPKIFQFVDIDYKKGIEKLDAFSIMPSFVSTNPEMSEKERLKFMQIQHSHYKQKGLDWKYENESRLMLFQPSSWIAGELIDFTKQEQLFNFNPFQLVGIVYGARMKKENINRIREILNARERLHDLIIRENKVIKFDFIEFQAKLSKSERKVDVNPIYFNNKPIEKGFEKKLKDWEKGIGWEHYKGSGKKVKID